MTPEQEGRFRQLLSARYDQGFADAYYGLDITNQQFVGAFRQWARTKPNADRFLGPNFIDRNALEFFFQQFKVLPRKFAAANLGMTLQSFDDTMRELVNRNIWVVGAPPSPTTPIVAEAVVSDFRNNFENLRYVTFENHSTYCESLHKEIHSVLGVPVQALRCRTSELLEQDSADYAMDIEPITLKPVGIRYQLWLETKKPLNLKPDICSLGIFVAERKRIEPFLFAGGDLSLYQSEIDVLSAAGVSHNDF